MLAVLLPLLAAVGSWLFVWLRGVFSYWGLADAAARWLGVFGAAVLLGTISIRPIPIRTSAIAAIYLFLFSLLAAALRALFAAFLPSFAALGWFWQGGVFALVCSAALLLYGAIHGKRIVLTRYMLQTARPVLNGELRIALISDVHMGRTIDEIRLRRELERLSAEKPNLLIVAGDLVDDQTTPEQMRAACAAVGAVKTTFGVYFVYGNHDLAAHGPRPPYTKAQLDEALTDAGVRILDDRSAVVAGVTLAGRHDAAFARHADRAPLDELLRGANRNRPIVLVDHQPRELKEAAAAGVTLQLSGHTHAGQVWPMNWLAPLFGFSYGHRRIGTTDAIVSAGMGNRGSRLRSGCTAEMVLIRLLGPAG